MSDNQHISQSVGATVPEGGYFAKLMLIEVSKSKQYRRLNAYFDVKNGDLWQRVKLSIKPDKWGWKAFQRIASLTGIKNLQQYTENTLIASINDGIFPEIRCEEKCFVYVTLGEYEGKTFNGVDSYSIFPFGQWKIALPKPNKDGSYTPVAAKPVQTDDEVPF